MSDLFQCWQLKPGISAHFRHRLCGPWGRCWSRYRRRQAAEAVGRNPSAFGSILVMAIIGMALSEAIAIYGLIIAFTK